MIMKIKIKSTANSRIINQRDTLSADLTTIILSDC